MLITTEKTTKIIIIGNTVFLLFLAKAPRAPQKETKNRGSGVVGETAAR